jgi:antitoxin (DNA-binding transcriptional repressor) of toxin-antitoxin stability system
MTPIYRRPPQICLAPLNVRHTMSDMKAISMRELNRRTAGILDAVENGEAFELRRNGKVVGYLSSAPPPPEGKPDWKAHFQWLRKQPKGAGRRLLEEFEEERRRLRRRERALADLDEIRSRQ